MQECISGDTEASYFFLWIHAMLPEVPKLWFFNLQKLTLVKSAKFWGTEKNKENMIKVKTFNNNWLNLYLAHLCRIIRIVIIILGGHAGYEVIDNQWGA